MSEYTEVEKPFLEELRTLGWNIIDQGPDIPQNPSRSRRRSFREVLLPEIFHESVRALNPRLHKKLHHSQHRTVHQRAAVGRYRMQKRRPHLLHIPVRSLYPTRGMGRSEQIRS